MKNRAIVIIIFSVSALLIISGVSLCQEKKETPPPQPAQAPAPSAPAAAAVETKVEEKAQTPESPAPKAETEEAAAGEEEEEEEAVIPGNVTVNFKGADIKTVLAYISEVAGVDIVPAPDVKGVVDLRLNNKPWKVALDIIVRNYGFAYEREGDIIRVITLDKLKQEELATQAFSLDYGKAKDMVAGIKNIVTDRGKVMHDDRTNIVLVTDIPTNLYKISQVIEKLDKRTEQVLIEARVIETVLDDSEKLGIDWNIKVGISGAKRPTTIPFEAFKTPFNTKSGEGQAYFPQVQGASPTTDVTTSGGGSVTTQSTANFPSAASGLFGFPFAGTDQFTFGALDFTQFTAVLEAIKARANTDIVSNPRIATLNNNEASINIGETLNMPKYERSSTTGKMEITGYDPKDLGIKLKVTPHINNKGEIVVDLAPEISDLLRYDTLDRASGIVAPVFSQRQAKTQLMIKDGDTIFIGGLIKENNVDVRKKVPIIGDLLGDIPGIGLLVTKKEVTKRKTELIFFITVYLMSPGKDIKNMPSSNKAFIPMYTLTQGKDTIAKKRAKKRY